MTNVIIIYIIVSLLMGATNYLLTKNIILSLIVTLFFIFVFFFLVERKYKKYKLIKRKTKECINFINNFVITLSVNGSISTTLASISSGFSDELKDQISVITHLTDEDKIFYLDNYFENSMYKVFINLLKQYLYEGGDILDSTRILIFDSQMLNNDIDNFSSVSKNKIFQFSYMWLICFGILIATKFFMGEYYEKIQDMNYFPYAILVFFMVFGLCLYLILNHSFNLDFVKKDVKK